MSIEAMKQALEALKNRNLASDDSIEGKAIVTLRQAIEQAEKQEHKFEYTPYGLRADEDGRFSIGPLPRKEWVGLTDDERNRYKGYTAETFADGVIWAEAKLRERNI